MEPLNSDENSSRAIRNQHANTGAVISSLDKPRKHEKKSGSISGPVIATTSAIGIALYKFKLVFLAAIKALSLVKLGWILKGSSSLLLSLGLYMVMFGWRYAVTLVALIYVHEIGHYLWMKVKGLEPDAPVFVPLLGAYTAMKKMPPDPVVHAEVAYAGPLVGGLAALALYFLSTDTKNFYLLAAANTGLVLNLLQLVPMKPFDGGFIAPCISKKLAIVGVIITALLALLLQSILMLVLTIAGFFFLVRKKKGAVASEEDVSSGAMVTDANAPVISGTSLHTMPAVVSMSDRLRISTGYFGLAALLAWYYWLSETQLVYLVHHRQAVNF
jgi:Zn-dependent protease